MPAFYHISTLSGHRVYEIFLKCFLSILLNGLFIESYFNRERSFYLSIVSTNCINNYFGLINIIG